MEIVIKIEVDSDDLESQTMFVNGAKRLSVYPLSECPEDAIIGRALVSCSDVADYMQEAYEAGKRGEPFIVVVK